MVSGGNVRMASLPAGTVTFLFTDIEGSTTLLQRLGDRQPDWDEQAFEREVAEVRATH